MDFLICSRASSSATADEGSDAERLTEQHWSYMDQFADAMTARGPLLGPGRDTWAGSMHVVDLPGTDAVRAFVADEPYQRAGLFEEHSVWRFVNLLGRTMWEFAGPVDEQRFLVLARAIERSGADVVAVPADELPPELRGPLIVYGELRDMADDVPVGVVLAVQAPTREAARALLDDERAGLAAFDEVAVHDWEFGGRR